MTPNIIVFVVRGLTFVNVSALDYSANMNCYSFWAPLNCTENRFDARGQDIPLKGVLAFDF